jgi:hypothetical protein
MASSGMLRRVTLVRAHVSKELSASFIRVTRIGELVTVIALTSNRRMLRRSGISSKHASVARIGELGTTLAVTSNRRRLRINGIFSQRASVASYS